MKFGKDKAFWVGGVVLIIAVLFLSASVYLDEKCDEYDVKKDYGLMIGDEGFVLIRKPEDRVVAYWFGSVDLYEFLHNVYGVCDIMKKNVFEKNIVVDQELWSDFVDRCGKISEYGRYSGLFFVCGFLGFLLGFGMMLYGASGSENKRIV